MTRTGTTNIRQYNTADLGYMAQGLASELGVEPPEDKHRSALIQWITKNIGRLRRIQKYLN